MFLKDLCLRFPAAAAITRPLGPRRALNWAHVIEFLALEIGERDALGAVAAVAMAGGGNASAVPALQAHELQAVDVLVGKLTEEGWRRRRQSARSAGPAARRAARPGSRRSCPRCRGGRERWYTFHGRSHAAIDRADWPALSIGLPLWRLPPVPAVVIFLQCTFRGGITNHFQGMRRTCTLHCTHQVD